VTASWLPEAATWYRAQLDRDEQYALMVEGIAAHRAAQTRKAVAARRAVLDWLLILDQQMAEANWWSGPSVAEPVAALLAEYADRPGYDDRWRP